MLSGQFGNILLLTGYAKGQKVSEIVTLIDTEKNKTCQLTPFPSTINIMGGGMIETDGQPTPVVCGSNLVDECYLLNSTRWEQFYSVNGYNGFGQSAVAIDREWLFITGLGSADKRTPLLLNGEGRSLPSQTPISSGNWPCTTVERDGGTYRVIAVLGGSQNRRGMERFNCTGGENPACTKLADGPPMINEKYNFGCGALETSEVH